MCGRREMERDHPELCDWGDMDHDMMRAIAYQVSRGTVVQMHNNGEPLMYPYLADALMSFYHCVRQFNTNAKRLVERASEIIGKLEVLTISVIENDPEGEEQFDIVSEFLQLKGNDKPTMVYRLLGDVKNAEWWKGFPGIIARRTLHAPGGSYAYRKPAVVPEIGICLDLLTHLSIDRYGNISLCVRFDPEGKLRLGNVKNITLMEAWNGEKRRKYLAEHTRGNRNDLAGCQDCTFWGCPTG